MNMSIKERLAALQGITETLANKIDALSAKHKYTMAALDTNMDKIKRALPEGVKLPTPSGPEVEPSQPGSHKGR